MSFDDILSDLQKGIYKPIYLLMGEEPYFIDAVSNYIEANALGDADKVFNQTVFYGRDTSAVNVVHEAGQYPMMSQRRVVIVKEAQDLDKIGTLEPYIANPLESTVLVLCHKYKSVDKRLKIVKLAEKNGVVMETKRLYDYQMSPWISKQVAKEGLAIETKAADLMAEHIGTNLSAVMSAIEKLKTACADKTKTITTDIVAANIGVSKEYNTFELRDALFMRNVQKVNKIVKAFGQNEKQFPIQAVVSLLYGSFSKLFAYHYQPNKNPSVVAAELGEKPYSVTRLYEPGARNYNARKCMQIIGLLREYDMRSKGFGFPPTQPGDLLTELVFRIMN